MAALEGHGSMHRGPRVPSPGVLGRWKPKGQAVWFRNGETGMVVGKSGPEPGNREQWMGKTGATVGSGGGKRKARDEGRRWRGSGKGWEEDWMRASVSSEADARLRGAAENREVGQSRQARETFPADRLEVRWDRVYGEA